MPFQEVNSLDADVTVALGKTDKKTGKAYPKQAEGYYLGKRSVANKRGESALHFLQTAAGNLGVWGTTDLNRKLGQVIPGTMVRITSTGTKPTPNGDMYTYKVEEDKTNTIEVATSEASDASGVVAAEDSGYADDESDEEDDSVNYEPMQTNALAAAKRKAEVEALLKKSASKKN